MMFDILDRFNLKVFVVDLINVQRYCIIVYFCLINYGEGYDDIIDDNGWGGNMFVLVVMIRMEEYYKKMYGDELQVCSVVEVFEYYKYLCVLLEQDIFVCMIYGLFDEYVYYVDYFFEVFVIIVVFFGGIIFYKLILRFFFKIGLGMILQVVKENCFEEFMYKFGFQVFMQFFGWLWEWFVFCKDLILIFGLQGMEVYRKVEEVVCEYDEELV